MTYLSVCPVEVVASSPPPATCPVALALVSPTDAFSFGDLGIDATSIGVAAMWGFGAVVFLWSLGFGIGAALTAIRKL